MLSADHLQPQGQSDAKSMLKLSTGSRPPIDLLQPIPLTLSLARWCVQGQYAAA